MSQVFTAKKICEEALGAIGAFPVTESAADPEHLRRAMTWLDLLLAQLAGSTRLFALVPATITLTLEAGEDEYNLVETLGTELPTDKIQFPVNAWLEDGSGNRTPLTIHPRDKFEAIKTVTTTTGPPTCIYIDRLAAAPTLFTYPTVDASDTTPWIIKLDVQTYAPNVAPAGVTGTQPSGSVLTNFSQAWQRYMIVALAHDLGMGPIYKLSEQRLTRLDTKAKEAKTDLLAFENREHDTEPPVCEPWGL